MTRRHPAPPPRSPALRPRLARAAAVVAALGLAGCSPGPEEVRGQAGPVVATAPSAPATSRPAPAARPSGTPTPPARYEPFELRWEGLTVRLPVPAGWSRTRTARGVDFGDPSGTVLLRVELGPRSAPTARAGWEAAEVEYRRSLAGYRRLGLADVPGIGDDAADLTFTFVRDGVTRRVIDRGIVVGGAGLAVYYSAPLDVYDRMAPVFDRASRSLQLS